MEELSIELKKKSKFTFSTSSRNGRRSLARCLRGLEVMSCNTVFGKKSKKIFADDGDMNINHKTKTAEKQQQINQTQDPEEKREVQTILNFEHICEEKCQ